MRKFLTILILLSINTLTMANTHYTVSFENRNEHYVNVTMEIPMETAGSVVIGMPVWTPGSYKIREFSQHVDFCEAFDADLQPIAYQRISKNQWKLESKTTGNIYFRYRVYAFEVSVRQSYCDQYYAFLHGTGIFMYAKGFEEKPYTLKIVLPFDWKHAETAMESKNEMFIGPDYDALVDAPIACGNFDIAKFDLVGIPHKIVMVGEGNYDLIKFYQDVKKICEEATHIFGSHPCKQYIHFIQNVASGGGGLEHANSQTSQMIRTEYQNPVAYKHLLALVGHEYFHLWNVKRLRPEGLGPFDYDKEVYTDLLWFSEGFTSYFDDLMALRAGFYTQEEYFEILGNAISQNENLPGARLNSIAESSFNAWVKTYLNNENTANTQVSYYSKGMLVAWLTDMTIRDITKGKKSLDDFMKAMYDQFYLKKERGFVYADVLEMLEKISNKDFESLYQEWVKGTKSPDYANICSAVGLNLTLQETSTPMSLGIRTMQEKRFCSVTFVKSGSAGSKAGLSVHDEIVRVNGKPVKPDLETVLSKMKAGEKAELEIRRQGVTRYLTAWPETSVTKKYTVKSDPNAEQKNKNKLQGWLTGKQK
jgi:hypothetical protein